MLVSPTAKVRMAKYSSTLLYKTGIDNHSASSGWISYTFPRLTIVVCWCSLNIELGATPKGVKVRASSKGIKFPVLAGSPKVERPRLRVDIIEVYTLL